MKRITRYYGLFDTLAAWHTQLARATGQLPGEIEQTTCPALFCFDSDGAPDTSAVAPHINRVGAWPPAKTSGVVTFADVSH